MEPRRSLELAGTRPEPPALGMKLGPGGNGSLARVGTVEVSALPIADSRYASTRWLPGPHLVTIYARFARPTPRLVSSRMRVELPDRDFLDVDQFPGPASGAPLSVVYHGLEGSSRTPYVRYFAHRAQLASFAVAALNFRGCSGAFERPKDDRHRIPCAAPHRGGARRGEARRVAGGSIVVGGGAPLARTLSGDSVRVLLVSSMRTMGTNQGGDGKGDNRSRIAW